MAKGRGIFLGLLLASVGQLLALFLSGAGHGWTTPLLASLLLWVVTPAAFVLARPAGSQPRRIFLVMALVAVTADAWLIKSTIDEGNALPFYLEVNGVVGFLIVGLWIVLWLLWQGIAIRALLFGRKGNE